MSPALTRTGPSHRYPLAPAVLAVGTPNTRFSALRMNSLEPTITGHQNSDIRGST